MKYSSDKLASAIITGICLMSSACREQNIQTKVIKSEIIDNHTIKSPKEVKTTYYSFNTSSISEEGLAQWNEILKAKIKREKKFGKSSTLEFIESSDIDE